MISFIRLKECAASLRCLAKLYAWLLLWKGVLCSLYVMENCIPVCPIYALLQLGQDSLYAPDSEYISVCLSRGFCAYVSYSVLSVECYLKVCLSEDVCNV